MNVEIEDRAGVKVLHFHGMLSHESEEAVAKSVVALLSEGAARIVLDLGAVNMINSAGLGSLVHVAAQANSQNCRLVLARPTPFVSGVLETTKLNRFFEVHPTIDAACAAVDQR